eukprot:UN28408
MRTKSIKKVIKMLYVHAQYIKSYMATGSHDNTIKLWDLEEGVCVHTFEGKVGHTDWVECVAINKDCILSGSYDKTLKWWSLEKIMGRKNY